MLPCQHGICEESLYRPLTGSDPCLKASTLPSGCPKVDNGHLLRIGGRYIKPPSRHAHLPPGTAGLYKSVGFFRSRKVRKAIE